MDTRNIIIERAHKPTAEEFVQLMSKTEILLNDYAQNHTKLDHLSPKEVEKLSLSTIQKACEHTSFDPKKIYLVEAQSFPDIVAHQNYGVEVKCTQKDHWTSTGSSIIESTRVKGVERIYMLFGKLGGAPAKFKCRPYDQVLSGITVTHSPRYLIDMMLKDGESIFDKMGTTYDELRTSPHSISQVRRYYREKTNPNKEMPWWLADGRDEEALTAGISLRTWEALSDREKEWTLALLLYLFPKEIIQRNYKRIALWCATSISLLLYNARDFFSAGGQGKYLKSPSGVIEELQPRLPHTHIHFVNQAARQWMYIQNADFLEQLNPFLEEVNPYLIAEGKKPSNVYQQWTAQVSELLAPTPFASWISEGKEILT